MKAKSFTEKRKLKSENRECESLTMKKRRKHRAGKYSINEEVNVVDSEDFIITIIKDGETIMDVECGTNKAKLTLEKLWQGSKGQCVDFQGSWLTPNEFQYVSGRETAKDWKRSIRHQGKSIKLLLSKGYIKVTTEGLNEENTNETQQTQGRKKRRGKGVRRGGGRKAKLTDTKPPVLADLPGHLNGVQLSENTTDGNSEIVKGQDSKTNLSESTDESHDGNETDETIENYYSENEYSYAKENNKSEIQLPNKKVLDNTSVVESEDKNTTDFNQNVETETEDEEEKKGISTDTIETYSTGGTDKKDQTNPHIKVTENCDTGNRQNESIASDESVAEKSDISDSTCETTPYSTLTQENQQTCVEEATKQCVGAITRITKNCMESDRDKDGELGKDTTDETCNENQQFDSEHYLGAGCKPLLPNSETLSDSMPSIVDDVQNSMPSLELEQSLKTADSPPTLVPHVTEMDNSGDQPDSSQFSGRCTISTTDQGEGRNNAGYNDTDEPKEPMEPKNVILSLPLISSCHVELDSKVSKTDMVQEGVDTPNNVTADDTGSTLCSVKVPKVKRNKRKRAHIMKNDQAVQEKHIPIVKQQKVSTDAGIECKTLEKQKVAIDAGFESVSKSCVIEDVTYNKTDQSNPCVRPMLSKDEKTQNDCFMDKKPINIFPIISKRSESEMYDHHTSDRKSSKMCNSPDIPAYKTCSDKHKDEVPTLTHKMSPKDMDKPLINLSSTVPRINGEIHSQSGSPLQNSYDEYMRRLEASRNAISWNPLFPFFQSPRQYNGMHIPIAQFMPPYPPLLGSTGSQQRESYPDSLKTPISSPMQSPYIATSPPSFDVLRMTSLQSAWSDQGSISTSKSQLGKSSTCFNSKTKSSSDNPLLSLTIKPAHSVKPNSLCSGVKHGSMEELDSSTPLDLSLKKTKTDSNNKISNLTDLRKQKDTDHCQNRNSQVYSTEAVLAKKHRKLKHLWINQTDPEKQNTYVFDRCSCAKENIANWSVEIVCNFIKRLDGCSSYSEKFREHRVIGRTLQQLSRDDLIRGLGMKVGPAIVLSDAIRQEVQNSSRRSQSCHKCRSQSLRDEANFYV